MNKKVVESAAGAEAVKKRRARTKLKKKDDPTGQTKRSAERNKDITAKTGKRSDGQKFE